jgi:hypothetical protein
MMVTSAIIAKIHSMAILPRLATLKIAAFMIAAAIMCTPPSRAQNQHEDEIVANLSGGRVITHVSRELISFAVIDHPIEANSHPPRVMTLDATHVGVLFGAAEWQLAADPKPTRLDHHFERITKQDPRYQSYPDDTDPDLESIGVGFLERLRPLVAQLHNKLNFSADDPIFEVVIIGYAPGYGPEVWQVDYRIEQEELGARGKDYWQTRVLRPRFTQLYPPEGKKSPRTLVETNYPADLEGTGLDALILKDDPRIARLRGADPRFAKVLDNIDKGQAQKAADTDSTDLLRAMIPLIAGNGRFVLGTIGEQQGFQWVVAPEEPIETATPDKDQPYVPSLRGKTKPQ